MPETEAILTCEDCGDVAEVQRVPTGQDGVYAHRVNNLNPCRYGFERPKCPHVSRKVENES